MANGAQGEISPAVAAIVIILAIAIAGGVMYYMANRPAATPVTNTSATPTAPAPVSGEQGAGPSSPSAPAAPAAPTAPAPQPGGR